MSSEESPRRHQSFLAPAEQRLVRTVVRELPDAVTPLQLTRIGLFGAGVAAVALVGSRWSPVWLALLPLGMFTNWFGIAFDGALATYRGEERPRLGFVEHIFDLLSLALLIVAFGFSPFLSIESAFVILICFLLFSAYTYMRAAVRHVQQMAYIGMGATEFRILMVLWPFIAKAFGVDEAAGDGGVSRLDAAIMILAVIAVAGLAFKAFSDVKRVATEEAGGSRL